MLIIIFKTMFKNWTSIFKLRIVFVDKVNKTVDNYVYSSFEIFFISSFILFITVKSLSISSLILLIL